MLRFSAIKGKVAINILSRRNGKGSLIHKEIKPQVRYFPFAIKGNWFLLQKNKIKMNVSVEKSWKTLFIAEWAEQCDQPD